jgi:hypothetical protein
VCSRKDPIEDRTTLVDLSHTPKVLAGCLTSCASAAKAPPVGSFRACARTRLRRLQAPDTYSALPLHTCSL